MAIEITLKLPETLVEHAKRLGSSTQRDVETVLSDVLEMHWLTLENMPDSLTAPITLLSDTEVLALADAKMDSLQNQRLADLQAKGKISGLTDAERYELLALLQIYQFGQIRKSAGLAEAFRRDLRPALPA